jgi:hypothetical protein
MDFKAKRDMALAGFLFILGGTLLTTFIVSYGSVMLYLLIEGFPHNFSMGPVLTCLTVLSLFDSPIIGGIIGFSVFKRTRYSNPFTLH